MGYADLLTTNMSQTNPTIETIEAYASNNAYTNVAGIYDYPDNQGKITITDVDGINMVRNEPADNDLAGGYYHRNMNAPLTRSNLHLNNLLYEELFSCMTGKYSR